MAENWTSFNPSEGFGALPTWPFTLGTATPTATCFNPSEGFGALPTLSERRVMRNHRSVSIPLRDLVRFRLR